MHKIHMAEFSEEFAHCWNAAGSHIQRMAGGELMSWLKATLAPPFLEHLSFRLGNQLFFIRIDDEDGVLLGYDTASSSFVASALDGTQTFFAGASSTIGTLNVTKFIEPGTGATRYFYTSGRLTSILQPNGLKLILHIQ